MPNHRILFASLVTVVTIAAAPLADEVISPPAVHAAAGAPLGAPPLAASVPTAGRRDQQGAEGSIAPAGPALRSTLWSDPTVFGGLDFDRHPFLSAFVVVGTILAGLLITGRIRRGPNDGLEHSQPKAAGGAVVAKGTMIAKNAPPRPESDPT